MNWAAARNTIRRQPSSGGNSDSTDVTPTPTPFPESPVVLPPPQAAASPLQVFQVSVFAVEEKYCVGCHRSLTAPLFVSADVQQSYNTSKLLVNFMSIPSSRLFIRAGDGHCGVASCQGKSEEMRAAIQYWYDNGEKTAPAASQPSMPAAGTLPPLEAFKVSLYPLVRLNCVTCHGNGRGPQFAVADVASAYAAAKRRVDFARPSRSDIVEKSMDPHKGCSANCDTDGRAYIEAIEYWAASE